MFGGTWPVTHLQTWGRWHLQSPHTPTRTALPPLLIYRLQTARILPPAYVLDQQDSQPPPPPAPRIHTPTPKDARTL